MTHYERMINGLVYDPGDPEILEEQQIFQKKLWEFNRLSPSQAEEKDRYLREVFAECGDNCYIELPFRANWGGHHVHFGSGIYANYNLTVVDDGHIYVGDQVMFGPNVTVITAAHTVNPELREKAYQFNRDVHIGKNVWIGSNVTILPGVHIGENSVIGAGSIVTKDVPSDVVAVGNPCRILRHISEQDDIYYYKDDKLDWEELNLLL